MHQGFELFEILGIFRKPAGQFLAIDFFVPGDAGKESLHGANGFIFVEISHGGIGGKSGNAGLFKGGKQRRFSGGNGPRYADPPHGQ